MASWSTLPVELRTSIIRTTCEDTRGDPDDDGSCARMASAGLNLWHHLELNERKDIGYFVLDIVPKHAAKWRKVTLAWGDEDLSDANEIRGCSKAIEHLATTPFAVHSPYLNEAYAVFCAAFRHAMTDAGPVESLSLSGIDWPTFFCVYQPRLVLGQRIRMLQMHVPALQGPFETAEVLYSIRQHLEELRIDLDDENGVSLRDLDLFHHWNRLPDVVLQPDLVLQPRLPRLRVLYGPEALVLHMHEQKVSDCLSHITIIPDGEQMADFSIIVEQYSSSLRTLLLIERQWDEWRWHDVRRVWTDVMRPTIESCERHGVHFRWILLRALQDGREQCPADLVGLVELE